MIEGDIDEELLDVTGWANTGFGEQWRKTIRVPCHWSICKFPLDPRCPDEFNRDRFIGNMRRLGYEPKWRRTKEELFSGAISYARVRARWAGPYLIAESKLGSYFEDGNLRGWAERMRQDECRKFLRELSLPRQDDGRNEADA